MERESIDSSQGLTDYEAVRASFLADASPVQLQSYERSRDAALVRTSVAEMIYALRKREGLTQAQLAQRAGISQTIISTLESGSHMPRFNTLMRIAEAQGTSFEIRLGDNSFSPSAMAS